MQVHTKNDLLLKNTPDFKKDIQAILSIIKNLHTQAFI